MDVRLNRLFFRATSSGTLPRYSGGMARGMFFSALRGYDKHTAQEIHDEEGIKTYALSGFRTFVSTHTTLSIMDRQLGIERKLKRDNKVRPGDILYFDVATSSSKLQQSLPSIFEQEWKADKNSLDLEPLQIREADVDEILSMQLPNPVLINFITPLSFSTGPNYWVWPEPKLIMQNLISIWNTWFPDTIIDPDELLTNFAHKVRVRRAEGRVVSANAARKMNHTGWVGRVEFFSEDDESHAVFCNLLKLGFVTGIGRGRTAGLGRFYIPKVLHSDKLIKIN